MPSPGADVIVDFDFEDGLLYAGVQNLGSEPALEVRVEFSPPFRCQGGEVPVQSLALFGGLSFLAPGKKIRTLVDSSAAYFGRREPARVKAVVSWTGRDGAQRKATMEHNLEIYRGLAFLPAKHKEG
jgi:hypothetical protein